MFIAINGDPVIREEDLHKLVELRAISQKRLDEILDKYKDPQNFKKYLVGPIDLAGNGLIAKESVQDSFWVKKYYHLRKTTKGNYFEVYHAEFLRGKIDFYPTIKWYSYDMVFTVLDLNELRETLLSVLPITLPDPITFNFNRGLPSLSFRSETYSMEGYISLVMNRRELRWHELLSVEKGNILRAKKKEFLPRLVIVLEPYKKDRCWVGEDIEKMQNYINQLNSLL